MIKKANEAAIQMTDLSVRKMTYKILNDKFLNNNHSLISEGQTYKASTAYDLDELSAYRLNKMAGLDI